MVVGSGGEGCPQRLLGQVVEVQHAHLGIGGDAPGHAFQVSAVGGHGVGRRLGRAQLMEPSVDELGSGRRGERRAALATGTNLVPIVTDMGLHRRPRGLRVGSS